MTPGKTPVAWVLAAIGTFITVMVLFMLAGAEVYRAQSTLVVSPMSEGIDGIDQFEAIDLSNALGTAVTVFNSSDIQHEAMIAADIAPDEMSRFSISATNPIDTLGVRLDVKGPDERVVALTAEVERLGSALTHELIPDVGIPRLEGDELTSSHDFESPDIVVGAIAAYLTVLALMAGALLAARNHIDYGLSFKDLASAWIRGQTIPTPRPWWLSPWLLGVVAFIGLSAGFATSSLASALAIAGGTTLALLTLLALRFPEWLTIGLVLLVLLRISDVGTDFYGLPGVAVPYTLMMLAILGARRLVLGESRQGWIGLAVALGALVAVMSISSLTATDQALAIDSTIDVLKNGLVAILLIAMIRELGDLKKVIWTLIMGTSFLALLGIVRAVLGHVPGLLDGFSQVVNDVVDEEVVGFRIAGPIGDANFFGQLLVTIFPLALERSAREKRHFLRLAAVIGTLLIGWAIILTYSRGAIIGALVCVICMIVWVRPSGKTVLVGASVVVGVLVAIPTSYLQRVETIGQVFDIGTTARPADKSIQGRTSEMLVGLEMFHDYPLTGIGPANYPGRYLEYSSRLGMDNRLELRQPHSLPIEVAAELGLIGLMWWLIAAMSLGRGLVGARRVALSHGSYETAHYIDAITTSLIGFAVTALFLHLAFARFLWMMVGIAMAAGRLGRQTGQPSRAELESVRA